MEGLEPRDGESMLEWYFDNFIANDNCDGREPAADPQWSSQCVKAKSRQTSEMPVGSSTVHPETDVQIHNVVSAVNLDCQVDLNFIARNAWNVENNPKNCNALIMRLRSPRTTALVHRCGKLTCFGAKSVAQSRQAARRFARKVQKLGFPIRFLGFQIQNIVATCKTFPLNLQEMALTLPQQCSYETELCRTLFYRGIPGVTLSICHNGKMNILGAKKEADIYRAIDSIYPILSCFRKLDPAGLETGCSSFAVN